MPLTPFLRSGSHELRISFLKNFHGAFWLDSMSPGVVGFCTSLMQSIAPESWSVSAICGLFADTFVEVLARVGFLFEQSHCMYGQSQVSCLKTSGRCVPWVQTYATSQICLRNMPGTPTPQI